MNTNIILTTLSHIKNGAFFKVKWASEVKLTAEAKRNGHICIKETEATVRKGINYGNQRKVIAKVEAGEIPAEHKLSWGAWAPGYEGLLLQHKGVDYIRLYLGPNKAKVSYYLDGKPITIEDIKKTGYVLDSYWSVKNEKPDALSIKAENILHIG